jgi:hypothetical protein
MNNDAPAITSPRYWQLCRQVACWLRRATLLTGVAFASLIVQAVLFVARGDYGGGDHLADVACQAVWAAAFLTPTWILLRRWEHTAARFETGGTP